MIIIVPKWMEDKISQEMISYCWLYIIIQPDGKAFVYKDRFSRNQRFIEQSEIPELIKFYEGEPLYKTLTSF